MSFNVAIDGPAGAGKSTVAKSVAALKNFIYVDTGAMYRAMALYLLRKGVNREEPDEIGETCQNAEISIEYQNGEQIVLLDGENVNAHLRTEEVSAMASVSSAVPRVREKLLDLQRKLARTMSVVMDGRDIGTTILPDADVKIYLTASSLTRARRRYLEYQEKGEACDLAEIQKTIEERDQRDMTREISPLCQAVDAVLVDSSELTIDETVEKILSVYHSKVSEKE